MGFAQDPKYIYKQVNVPETLNRYEINLNSKRVLNQKLKQLKGIGWYKQGALEGTLNLISHKNLYRYLI